MLCLSRKVREEIIIGDATRQYGRIVIVEVKGDKVVVGLEFPKDIIVTRKELLGEEPNES